jgi:hypothetical protein
VPILRPGPLHSLRIGNPMTVVRRPESLAQITRRLLGKKWSHPTTYRGILFRSFLESRFAWHLDEMGEEWLYEPRRIGDYLPDFEIVSAARPTYVELKPTRAEVSEAQRRMEVIWQHVPDAMLIVACAEGCALFSCTPGGEWREWQERWRYD